MASARPLDYHSPFPLFMMMMVMMIWDDLQGNVCENAFQYSLAHALQ
jgi:hypothetical protein